MIPSGVHHGDLDILDKMGGWSEIELGWYLVLGCGGGSPIFYKRVIRGQLSALFVEAPEYFKRLLR